MFCTISVYVKALLKVYTFIRKTLIFKRVLEDQCDLSTTYGLSRFNARQFECARVA